MMVKRLPIDLQNRDLDASEELFFEIKAASLSQYCYGMFKTHPTCLYSTEDLSRSKRILN